MWTESRRRFLYSLTKGTLGAVLIPGFLYGRGRVRNASKMEQVDPYKLFNKHRDMVLLNDRPVNMEARAHLLDDARTPVSRMFIRNNGLVPSAISVESWTLTIEGEAIKQPRTYTLDELKSRFKAYSYELVLECGGNGRSEFDPPAKGNQWTVGAVSCAKWTGLRLRDLLEDAGYTFDAVYIGYYGADKHLSGDINKVPISRGVPIGKALQDETLLAYKMNDEDLPLAHGYPLRLVAGGWPASASGKWLNKLTVRDRVHDGPKMGGQSYRIPCDPVAPGSKPDDDAFCIIESMPVKSLITYPRSGAILSSERALTIRGHAWAGELAVRSVDYSIDFGATWHSCSLESPANRLAWQQWKGKVRFPKAGYYEVWARATDEQGNAQPMVVPGWNPKGYLNNACHRIAVRIKA